MTYAVAHGEVGIWGGTTFAERKNMGSSFTDTIRDAYYQAGLLEFRPGEVEYYLERKKKQLTAEQSNPTVPQDSYSGPTSDPYYQAS